MKYLKVFTDFARKMDLLGDAERGRLFTAMLLYAETGTETELKGNERFLWGVAKAEIDREFETYHRKVEGAKKARAHIRSDINLKSADISLKSLISEQDKDKEKDNTPPKPPKGGKSPPQFRVPSLEEVAAYCSERGNSIDASHFCDYYAANGWRVGRQPMKDWKAAVRNWERMDHHAESPKGGKASPRKGPDQETRDRRVNRNVAWMREFLAEQREKEADG